MAALNVWLTVENQQYRLLHCNYGADQSTGGRGEVDERVRYAVVEQALDVPADDLLLSWAGDPAKRLAASLVFVNHRTNQIGIFFCH